jgi:two-component system sensor histidine kinase/response regulator
VTTSQYAQNPLPATHSNPTLQNMTKHTILCVDDEIDNVDALERLFRRKYSVLKATSGREALQVLDKHPGPIALIITDQRMPEMAGVEFLQQSIQSHPETTRILLTGYTDLESIIMAVNKGEIFRYLTKPWDPTDLTNTVDRAVEHFLLGQELKQKNKDLSKALDELKSLDVAKSNFMILINHELKTPLTSILSFGALLSETSLDSEQTLMLQRILRSGDRLKALIDDVLLIVRAETNQLKIDKQMTVFSHFEEIGDKDIRDLITKKNLKFVSKIDSQPVPADTRLMRQVFNRLLHNAAKFADDSSEIQIESTSIGNFVRFMISNEGSKIPAAIVNKITKPFYIDEDVMHHSTGTGLGLTICQAILKSHGSSLQFANSDQGVTVFFDLNIN